ncbi:MAG: hypothetical protein J6C65_00075 [Prevotella sp.]|nr:hypothetical protein [Prevotella sp.]
MIVRSSGAECWRRMQWDFVPSCSCQRVGVWQICQRTRLLSPRQTSWRQDTKAAVAAVKAQ